MSKPLLATCAIIRKEDKILIAQRMPNSKYGANLWEFPGGKVEYLEHPEESLVREILEELDITIKVDKLLTIHSHIYDAKDENGHIILLAFLCDYVSGDVQHLEVQNTQWVTPSEFYEFTWAAADKPIVEHLLKHHDL